MRYSFSRFRWHLLAFWFWLFSDVLHPSRGKLKSSTKPRRRVAADTREQRTCHPERRRARGSSVLLVYFSGTTPRPSTALHLARCFEAKKKAGKKKTFPRSERELPGRSASAARVRPDSGLSSGDDRSIAPLAQTVFGAPKASRAKRTLRGRGSWPLEVISLASGQRAEARFPESEVRQNLCARRKERVKSVKSRFWSLTGLMIP